jgi:phytoene dehydrogenase-like protein
MCSGDTSSVTSSQIDAVVIGSGPNGLAAAITLARAGASVTVLEPSDEVGGGVGSRELTVPGVVHDSGPGAHPLAAISPFLRSLPLAEHGLSWRRPDVDVAHLLDGGRVGVLVRSLDDTAAGLGADGEAWRRAFAPLVARFDELSGDLLGPQRLSLSSSLRRRPPHPVTLARFGLRGLPPATVAARRFRGAGARALLGGIAAQSGRPLTGPATTVPAASAIAAGHRVGWPVPAGGIRALIDALVAILGDMGVKVETGAEVDSVAELGGPRTVLFDAPPATAARLVGRHLPDQVRLALERDRPGPVVHRIDLAVEGGLPWTAPQGRRAGTVHLGGPLEEVVAALAAVHRGRRPERPFVVVGQPAVGDPKRAAGGVHPIAAWTLLPAGAADAVTESVLAQIERFAPGARERVVGQHVAPPVPGAGDQLRRPWRGPGGAADPYGLGVPGMYLCSAATPPGPGAHGLCGHNAAVHALRHLDATSL